MPGNGEHSEVMPRDTHQQAIDHSWERQAAIDEAVAATLGKSTTELMAKFMALLIEHIATSMFVALKTSSGAVGISVMPPFDWIRDKATYQHWQAWSNKAKHAMKAMEGDSDEAKISYFHHWIDTKGIPQVETWLKNGVLLKQEDFDKLESEE